MDSWQEARINAGFEERERRIRELEERCAELEEALRPLVYGKTTYLKITYLYESAGIRETDLICVYCEYSVGEGHSRDCPIPRGRAALSPSEQEKEGEDG